MLGGHFRPVVSLILYLVLIVGYSEARLDKQCGERSWDQDLSESKEGGKARGRIIAGTEAVNGAYPWQVSTIRLCCMVNKDV